MQSFTALQAIWCRVRGGCNPPERRPPSWSLWSPGRLRPLFADQSPSIDSLLTVNIFLSPLATAFRSLLPSASLQRYIFFYLSFIFLVRNLSAERVDYEGMLSLSACFLKLPNLQLHCVVWLFWENGYMQLCRGLFWLFFISIFKLSDKILSYFYYLLPIPSWYDRKNIAILLALRGKFFSPSLVPAMYEIDFCGLAVEFVGKA